MVYDLAMDAIEDEVHAIVQHARSLLARGITRGWEEGLLSREDDVLLSGLLGSKEVAELIRTLPERPTAPSSWPELPGPKVPRLRTLAAAVGSDVAEDLLTILLAIDLDSTVASLASYLQGPKAGSALTVDALARVLGERARWRLIDALAAEAPLRRHRLIEAADTTGRPATSMTVRTAPRLLRWLLGAGALDHDVARFSSLVTPAAEPTLSPSAIAALEPLIADVERFLSGQRRQAHATSDMVLSGPHGAGRREVALEACRRLGRPVLVVHVPTLAASPNPDDAVAALLREELLLDAQPLLEDADALAGGAAAAQRLCSALGASTRARLVTASGPELPQLWTRRRRVSLAVPIVDADRREAIWREVMPEVDAERTASLYRIGVGAIASVADGARLVAAVRHAETIGPDDVAAAVRTEFETDLGTVATKVTVRQSWDDLVLPDDTRHTIAELVAQLRHRATVLGAWGYHQKLGKGVGTTALFTGEPGTGKSMVAGLIAKELGIELYQIDLARLVSKWIGETEKNLARVFDAAETGHVLLLFDEADALLSKRTTDVKSANDRHANVETNYILQRLEHFHGIAVLTSNLQSAIDPALSRRLSFTLNFPFPDEELRVELWRRMIPRQCPVQGEIDFDALAGRFDISGGHIRNIVLRAAYLAAADDRAPARERALTMGHILSAAEYEYRDHGMLEARGKLPT
jgi:hypothetical protein